MLRVQIALLTAVFLAPLPAFAADWAVDYPASRLGFVAQVGGAPVEGAFGTWTAEIRFDEAALDDASAVVIIDMASADTGDGTRDGTLRGNDFFAVGDHPEGRFESTAFRRTEDGAFEMDGALTMRGVTQDVTIPFTLEDMEDGGIRAAGSVTIDRSAFGIGQGDFSGEGTVAHGVEILLDVAATPGS